METDKKAPRTGRVTTQVCLKDKMFLEGKTFLDVELFISVFPFGHFSVDGGARDVLRQQINCPPPLLFPKRSNQ